MKKILITGVLNQPYSSWPVVSQSDDGITWDLPTQPFPLHDTPTGIANDGTVVAVSNSRGYLSVTSDLQDFSQIEVSDGLGITGIGFHEGDWVVAGSRIYTSSYGSYPSMSEVAQIYRAASAYGDWEMVWSHPETDSRIYQLKWFNYETTGIWIACGSVGTRGDSWYSIDDGASWIRATIPAGVSRILSVERVGVGTGDYWYWGCDGQLFRSPSLDGTNWSQISVDTKDPILDISYHNESLVITGLNTVYSSQDGFFLKRWDYPGYYFDRIRWFDNDGATQWLVFARSQLISNTYWSTVDFSTWDANTNNIHVTGSTLRL